MRTASRLLLTAALLPVVALSSTLVPHTLEDRARTADRVSLVQVLSRQTVVEGADPRRMRTETQVLVADDLKGQGPQRVTIVQLGGTWGPWASHIPGDAVFTPGELAVVFLACPRVDRCSLVALGEGKLSVDGDRVQVRDLFTGTTKVRPLPELLTWLRAAVKP